MLKELLKNSFRKAGSFSPFTYTIGLEFDFLEYEKGISYYPIPEPYTEKVLDDFTKSLTYIHEHAHLIQYLSTSFGLRGLRLTLIALKRLKGNDANIAPLLKGESLEKAIGNGDFMRFLSLIDVLDQFKIHKTNSPSESQEESVTIWNENWSPYFHFYPERNLKQDRKVLKILKDTNALIKEQPHLVINTRYGHLDIVINAAVLMETFATLTELNHIYNAFLHKLSLQDIYSMMPEFPEYSALIYFGFVNKICEPKDLLTLAVCIDLALMYDPFVFYNSSPVEIITESEIQDCYPGYTFMKCCEVSKQIEPIKSHEDLPRFYNELCSKMNIPSPKEMTQMALDRIEGIMPQNPEQAFLYKAILAHRKALKKRLEDPYNFLLLQMRREATWELSEIISECVTFYDLRNLKPQSFYYDKIDLHTIHNLIVQAFSNSKIECPLKYGEPFYCDAFGKPSNVLCKWHSKEQDFECHVDIFEQFFNVQGN